jgi:hypothetical protein
MPTVDWQLKGEFLGACDLPSHCHIEAGLPLDSAKESPPRGGVISAGSRGNPNTKYINFISEVRTTSILLNLTAALEQVDTRA